LPGSPAILATSRTVRAGSRGDFENSARPITVKLTWKVSRKPETPRNGKKIPQQPTLKGADCRAKKRKGALF